MRIVKHVWKKVVLPTVTATSAMTWCSYVASHLAQNQFREPELLQQLFSRKQPAGQPPVAGFLLHYLAGIGFTSLYQYGWKKAVHLPPVPDGLGYGALSGLIGIAMWKVMFATHPSPPDVNFKKYLVHLWVVHLVYGVVLSQTASPSATSE